MKKSIFCGVAAAACWGLSNVLSKALLAHFQPLSLLLIQLLGSNALLWTLRASDRKSKMLMSANFRYSLPGLLQPGLAFVFGIFGLNLTTANADALLWTSETIIVILLSWLILRESFSWYLLFLAIIGTGGTVMATAPDFHTCYGASILSGNALILVGVFCAALYSIYTQSQLNKVEPLRLISLHQLAGLVLVSIVWLICLPFAHLLTKVSGLELLLALISGTTQYAFSFWLYLYAMKGLGAARSSILLVLPPLFTICGSFFFLAERLNCLQWVGVLVAISAVSGICVMQSRTARSPC